MANLCAIDYFRAREKRECEMADAAQVPAAAAIHSAMARRYFELIEESLLSANPLGLASAMASRSLYGGPKSPTDEPDNC